MISVVVPVFNEEGSIRELHQKLVEVLGKQPRPFEIIFVNDGSRDKTEEIAKTLHPLKLISLHRNYGQTPAIDVGIHQSRGDIVMLIDADLQNDPSEILNFVNKIDEGYDVVLGWRKHRPDHWTRVIFSKVANKIARSLLGVEVHDFGCGLKAYRSRLIKDFRLWGEAQVFLSAVAKERGARLIELPVEHYSRQTGVAKVKISKMIRGIFDLLGIVFFVKYFSKPLRFFGGWGLFFVGISSIAFIWAFILKLREIHNFSDTPLLIVGTLFAILGVILFMMGLLAEMLLRLHYADANRSPYTIRDVIENK